MLKIHPSNFTWVLWRGGTLFDLGVQAHRYSEIISNSKLLSKYAIGYCNAGELSCRPKPGEYAVMFQKGDIKFWIHLRSAEFNKIRG